MGAYSYALLSTTFGLSFWICLPLAGILAAFWGIILGFPVLRLRGDYLAIVTLAFGEIIRLVLINWTDLTNGYAGISSIPRATFFGVPFTDDDDGFAHLFGLEYSPIQRTIFLFYLILVPGAADQFRDAAAAPPAGRPGLGGVARGRDRLPVARHQHDEHQADGLRARRHVRRLRRLVLRRAPGLRQPESFTFIESATILAIVVLGGMGSQIGVAIAAVVMIGGTELLRELDFLKQIFGADFDPGAIPHADLRRRHGADDDLEAARHHLDPRRRRSSSRSARRSPDRLVKEGHG